MQAIIYNPSPAGWALSHVLSFAIASIRMSAMAGVRMAQCPPPELPGDDWVRVRTRMGGICGTDLGLLAQRQPVSSILQAYSSLPIMLGHENVAIVEEIGPAVDPAWKGVRVCVEPTLGCLQRGIEPACPSCSRGQFGACENFGASGQGRYHLPAGTSIGYNSRTGGSYGEYFVAHVSQLVAVPDSMSDEHAVLTDPLACSLHAVLRADLSRAANVLVYGAGMLGLGVVGFLRATGFAGTIDIISRSQFYDDLAVRLGASKALRLPTDPAGRFDMIASRCGGRVQRVRFGNLAMDGGYDVVFDCAGSAQSIQESLKWARSRGQVVMVATGHAGPPDVTPLWFQELTVIGSYGRQMEDFQGRQIGTYQLVHELWAAGKIDIAGLLTHTFRLEEYRHAFELSMRKSANNAVRVAFDFR